MNGAKVLARAWTDLEYKQRLLEHGTETISELGFIGREIRVWDSTADVRYMVLPERPEGSEGMTREQLEELATRDSMIGVAKAGRI